MVPEELTGSAESGRPASVQVAAADEGLLPEQVVAEQGAAVAEDRLPKQEQVAAAMEGKLQVPNR